MKNIEVVRREVIDNLFDMKTMQTVWPVWKATINSLLGARPTVRSLLDLGENLADVFSSTGEAGRKQDSLSGGGAAWEGLVCWYLNLCLVDTPCVVFKKAKMIPAPITKSITVLYGTVATNTESDLVAVTFPDISIREVPPVYKNALCDQFSADIEVALRDVEVCVIQCKTNWNDNAQIPMLWDMIYTSARSGLSGASQVSVGVDGFSVKQLKSFSYAFVTVPSNKKAKYKSESTAVLRVRPLSGGNYWGKASVPGVALRLSDILGRNFANAISSRPNGWPADMQTSLDRLNQDYGYFRLGDGYKV